MFRRFLILQWKTATRSPMWQKNLALNLVVGFFLVLLGLELLMLGIFMDKLLSELFPDDNPFKILNGIILYYFLMDLLIRFMMQSLPRLTVESYLHLPVKKQSIIHFMETRTIIDVFNLIPLLVFIPTTFTLAIPEVGVKLASGWIISLLFLILANNFLVIFLKRMLGSKPIIVGITALVIILIILLDKTGFISLAVFSAKVFGYLSRHPFYTILPFIWMIFTYLLQFRFLKNHMYPDEIQVSKTMEIEDAATNRYLKSLGLIGSIISLETKLYLRNKRTKTILYMMPVFLLYGLMFYPQPDYINDNGWLMFVGIFMTGGMMLNYCNYAFGYESAYFDTLLTKNIDFNQYIRVKYIMAVLIATACYVLTIPYVYFGYKILLINTSMYLYNIGILSFVLLYFATYNKKKIDLSRGGAFNYQGIGAMNWLALLPAFILPILVYLPFRYSGYPYTGIAFIGLIGIAGLFFSKVLIRIITGNFYRRKYIMAACFREKS